MLLPQRDLFGAGSGRAHGGAEGHQPLFLQIERRATLHVEVAAERVRAGSRRETFHQLHLLEERTGDTLQLQRAVGADAGHALAVHRDGVQRARHAADHKGVVEALHLRDRRDARQTHDDLAHAHVRQVAEGIHRDDILHVVGIALHRQGQGVALALAGHLEGIQFIDTARQLDVAGRALAFRHRGLEGRGVEARVAHLNGVGPRRQPRQHEAAGVVRLRRDAELRDGDDGALEVEFRRGVADESHHAARAAGGGRGGG